MIRNIKFLFIITALLWSAMASSAAVSIRASLDSLNLLMGNMAMLEIEAVQDKGKPGGLELFRNIDPSRGYVGVCGDSIELRTSYKVDTVEVGSGRIQLNYHIPVQAFDSGTFRLPEFVYISESDTARSNVLTLNVVPVTVKADDPIAGYALPAEPEGKKITDALPDWMAEFWWLILLAVLIIAAAVWAYTRFRKTGSVITRKPEPTPYEVAMSRLRDLKKRNLWEQGLEKEYFTRLTDILRIYLEKRFGINAMEMTSREIMDRLYDSDLKDKRDYMRQILHVADFVKFAKVRPLPADNIEAYENAVKFVEETKPVELPESSSDNKDQTKKGGTK